MSEGEHSTAQVHNASTFLKHIVALTLPSSMALTF